MKFVADLHLHSHYSRATSKNLDFEHLSRWAQLKGVQVVGTGDIAHPGWLQEMQAKLEPAEAGLFKLKDEVARPVQAEVPPACRGEVRFMLAGEISSIYKKHDRVRKVHNVIFAPSLAAVEKIQAALEKIGNIRSDGRPILGLPSRDLLEIILEIDPACHLIPAHIWTPWFSLLGSKSGYDSVEACFEDLTPHIFALETGLSSDPPMNWRVSALDRYTLVSNSDAHSPQKLAREATVFDTELSYPALFAALQSGDPATFRGTIEFFPEEGKYHHDGHRKCNLSWQPQQTIAHGERCPVCGKPVTVGVLHRVEALADRPVGRPPRPHPFTSLIPLPEVLGEIHGVGPTSKTVQQAYELLLAKLGPELSILQDIPLAEIERVGGPRLAEGLRRMRAGEVRPIAGYDGQPGLIKLFGPQDEERATGQLSFLAEEVSVPPPAAPPPEAPAVVPTAVAQPQPVPSPRPAPESASPFLAGLNPQQQAAVRSTAPRLIIVAGPGTGKTRTLTYRLAQRVAEQGVAPSTVLAITFTNKAAEEMRGRLEQLLGPVQAAGLVIKTFHALGAMLLREAGRQLDLPANFGICGEAEQVALLKQARPALSRRELGQHLAAISAAKSELRGPAAVAGELAEIYAAYQQALRENQLLDFDDLIFETVRLLEQQPETLAGYRQRFRWLAVDEFQDVNLAQYRLLQLLTDAHSQVCLIGDPDQAIYGFRGATPKFFEQFSREFAPVETLRLSQNYRSSRLILAASGQVIEQNPAEARVKIWSEIVDKTRLVIHQAATEKAEAEAVVHTIERMIGGTSYFSIDSGRSDNEEKSLGFADFAVLYRLGALSQPLLEAFERSGMPYQTVGQTPLADYREVKVVLACLGILANPELVFPLAHLASARQLKAVRAALAPLRDHPLPPVAELIEQIQPLLTEQGLLALDEPGRERLQQLRRRAIPFAQRLGDFLEALALQQETDFYDPRADRVTLMTLHAAKGLEFPVVFIIGCEEGLLPYARAAEAPDLAEERRLLYVGMTRARQRLILSHAHSRLLFGRRRNQPPSRFLGDIAQALTEIERSAPRPPAKEKPENPQLPLF